MSNLRDSITLSQPSNLPAHLASSGPTWARPWWRRRKHCSAPPYSPSPRIEPADQRRLGRGTGPKLPLSILSSREWPNLWQVHTIHGGKSKILSSATFTNDWKWYLEGLESEGAASLKARSFYIYIYLLHSSSFYKLPVVIPQVPVFWQLLYVDQQFARIVVLELFCVSYLPCKVHLNMANFLKDTRIGSWSRGKPQQPNAWMTPLLDLICFFRHCLAIGSVGQLPWWDFASDFVRTTQWPCRFCLVLPRKLQECGLQMPSSA